MMNTFVQIIRAILKEALQRKLIIIFLALVFMFISIWPTVAPEVAAISSSAVYQGRGSIIFAIDYAASVQPRRLNEVGNENTFIEAWVNDEVFINMINDRVRERLSLSRPVNTQILIKKDRIVVTYAGTSREVVEQVLTTWIEEFMSVLRDTFSRNSIDIANLERQLEEMTQRLTIAQTELEQFVKSGEMERTRRQIDQLNVMIDAITRIDRNPVPLYADQLIRYEQLIREAKLIRSRVNSDEIAITDLLAIMSVQSKEFGSPPTINFRIESDEFRSGIQPEYIDRIIESLEAEYNRLKSEFRGRDVASDRLVFGLDNLQNRLIERSVYLQQLEYRYNLLIRERDFARDSVFRIKDQINNIKASNFIPFLVRPIGVIVEDRKLPDLNMRSIVLRAAVGVLSAVILGIVYATILVWRDPNLRSKIKTLWED